jgi:hypothetical protein
VLSVVVIGLFVGLLLIATVAWMRARPGRARLTRSSPGMPLCLDSASLDRHVTMILHLQDGRIVDVERPEAPRPWFCFDVPPVWYRRLRIGVSLTFLLMVLLALFVQSGLADSTRLAFTTTLTFFQASHATDVQTLPHGFNASRNLVRISQLDPAQYASQQEYDTWAYSACSTASMTEVFNAYGRHYRITDVLQVEAALGQITPQLGLVAPDGIAITAAKFGFKTDWGEHWSLNRLISTANSGYPVIVSFPPDRYDGGHLLVVLGGDSTYVYLADSSAWNRRQLTYDQFLQWWGGYAALVTPA